MSHYKKKIVITGGTGRFGDTFKKQQHMFKFKFFFPNKSQLNILNYNSIRKFLNKIKPKYLIHLAGLSRPMSIHNKNIMESIDKNIIGTANITKASSEKKIKLIYV